MQTGVVTIPTVPRQQWWEPAGKAQTGKAQLNTVIKSQQEGQAG
jgi:hypothetical protein